MSETMLNLNSTSNAMGSHQSGGGGGGSETSYLIAYLTTISIVGTIGNLIVAVVYYKKKDKQTSTFFILTLAFIDLTVCSVLLPMTIYIESILYETSNLIFCKTFYFLLTTAVPSSSLLMTAIAFDRYFCICMVGKNMMTLCRARVVTSVLLALSGLLGVIPALAAVTAAAITTPDATGMGFNSTTTATLATTTMIMNTSSSSSDMCRVDLEAQHSSFGVLLRPFKFCYDFVFIACVVIITVLYIFIYKEIYTRRKTKRDKKRRLMYSSFMNGGGAAKLMLPSNTNNQNGPPNDENSRAAAAAPSKSAGIFSRLASRWNALKSDRSVVNDQSVKTNVNQIPLIKINDQADRAVDSKESERLIQQEGGDSSKQVVTNENGGGLHVEANSNLSVSVNSTIKTSSGGGGGSSSSQAIESSGGGGPVIADDNPSITFNDQSQAVTTAPSKIQRKQKSSLLRRSLKSHPSAKNMISTKDMRTAFMLFVVSFLYIVFYTPSIIYTYISLLSVPDPSSSSNSNTSGGGGTTCSYCIIFSYLYYSNSAINPIIYCFLNPTFRADLFKIFFKRGFIYDRCIKSVK